MSQSRTITYTCPYCGGTFETEIYESVHADKDPDLRERCLSGDLFRVFCPHCKHDFMIQFPLVYMDAPHRFVIWRRNWIGRRPYLRKRAIRYAAVPNCRRFRKRFRFWKTVSTTVWSSWRNTTALLNAWKISGSKKRILPALNTNAWKMK